MREYAKVAPTFWTGATGKELRRRGSEAVVVALYLMSSPHSNMLGLYYQPALYMAHETGLGIEGASKGLQHCIEARFCSFDPDTEMVWVPEMASYQIGDELVSGDKRCKGIQKDYEALPKNPFLAAFFERYGKAFHLTRLHPAAVADGGKKPSPFDAPSKPGAGAGAGAGDSVPDGTGAAAPKPPANDLPDPAPLTDRDRMWLLGPPLLGDSATTRSLLGKLAKTYGDDVLAAVLAEATANVPIEPKAWVTAACATRAKAKPKVNGHPYEPADLLADPTPEWATRAGFADRFQAENAGCGPGNAAQFRDGRRVE
jgi:hypothetical protein